MRRRFFGQLFRNDSAVAAWHRGPMRLIPIALFLAAIPPVFAADSEPSKITHSFFIAGGETAILSNDGKPLWSYPAATRDGFVPPNGNLLLALSKNKDYPGGAVVEVTRDNKIVF